MVCDPERWKGLQGEAAGKRVGWSCLKVVEVVGRKAHLEGEYSARGWGS